MKKYLLLTSALLSVNLLSAQGKFSGGNGDGFASATVNNIVLPSSGLVFKGSSCGEDICLNWHTMQELNTAYFRVERMNNVSSFEMVGRVEAAGNSNHRRDYSFIDKWPLNGTNYYRLMQTDNDGRYVYSATIPVEHQHKKLIGRVSNLAGSQLVIQLLQPSIPVTLLILDMQGKLLLRSVHNGISITEDISRLAAGMYIIVIELNGKKENRMFIKM